MTRRARDYLLALEELAELRRAGRGNTLRATDVQAWLTENEATLTRAEWEAIYARLAAWGEAK